VASYPAYPYSSAPAMIPHSTMNTTMVAGAGALSSPTVAVQFDAGARFDGVAQPRIPPPPPGVAPNAAQLALMKGQAPTVIAQKKKSTIWDGVGGGGYTFW